jgi:tRNA U34 2-thiouridine synthase MnmA/TrmU
MKKKYKCFALFSGGLDSIIAVLHMKKLEYEVIPVFFNTPFFGPEKALKAASQAGIELRVIDITREHIDMLRNPRYGFGKNLNPCIDCHGLMFRKAGEMLVREGVDFLISGEVLGQRPMSQRFDALNSVGKLSQVKDLLVRPLSQKLLADTLPLREGWVDKQQMLDIQGRGRHRQIALAKDFGITEYQNPGGGCLLTDKGFSQRLKDLMDHNTYDLRQIELIKTGRHFRLAPDCKLIVGKNDRDNEMIGQLAGDDLLLQTKNYPGPLGLLLTSGNIEEHLQTAASVVLRYNNKAPQTEVVCYGKNFNLNQQIEVEKMEAAAVEKLMI